MAWESEAAKAEAIIARIVNEGEPSLEDIVAAATQAAGGYRDALSAVVNTSAILDRKLQAVADEDATLDRLILHAADEFVFARFTTRNKPFGSYCSLSPSKLTRVKLAREVKEVNDLVANAAQANPPEPVVKVLGDLLKQASQVRTRLEELTKPQAEADKSIAARTEAALELKRTMRKLRLRAELVWPNEPKRLERLFAAPEDIQDPARRKRKPTNGAKAEPSEPEHG